MNADDPALLASLAACADEPIHTPGAIQPAGVLCALDPKLTRFTHLSGNTASLLGQGPKALFLLGPDAVLPPDLMHALRSLAGVSTLQARRERVGTCRLATGAAVEVSCFANEQAVVIELIPVPDKRPEAYGAIEAVRRLVGRYERAPSLQHLMESAVRGLRELTGYDRVMAYRFLPNGDGEVVAEALASGLSPYLGLRYPASDIPPQARALYLRTPLRFIADVVATPALLYAADEDAQPLDLSLSLLRAVSPVHLVYLANMGVGASLSLAIVVDGALWGLVACHHHGPWLPSPDLCATAELLGYTLGLLVTNELARSEREARERAQGALDELAAAVGISPPIALGNRFFELLLRVVPADGVVFMDGSGEAVRYGETPATEVSSAVQDLVARRSEDVWSTDQLAASISADSAACRHVAGVLGVTPAPSAHPMELHFYRTELLQTVRWAGQPEKNVTHTPDGPRLSPRRSFEEFRRSIRGQCRPWSRDDLTRAEGLAHGLLRMLAHEAQQSRERALLREAHHQKQDLLVAELSHRVKNVLALVRSITRQTRVSSPVSVDNYAESLEQRISALANAHDLAARGRMTSVDLRELWLAELSPYRGRAALELVGPSVGLRAEVAPIMALVLHELVSNAAKYGALSQLEGRVMARWSVDAEGLSLQYREFGGPTVAPPARRGFGVTLLERAISYELDGRATLTFAPDGVSFTAWLPRALLVAGSDLAGPSDVLPAPGAMPLPGAVLVVEDNLLLATDLEDSLRRAGCGNVASAGSVAGALRALTSQHFDAAVLDMNLRGELAFPVAARLVELGIPFAFLSGYGAELQIPEAFGAVPRMKKPLAEAELLAQLSALVAPPHATCL
jgi:light-regulated signal transduction histidine kinase (bacteriophytochrome)/CheY-like chemotaxis protein